MKACVILSVLVLLNDLSVEGVITSEPFLCPPEYDAVGDTCYRYEKNLRANWEQAQQICRSDWLSPAGLIQFETREEWLRGWEYLQTRHHNCYLFQNTLIWTGQRNLSAWQQEELAVGMKYYDALSSLNDSDDVIALQCTARFAWSRTPVSSERENHFICEAEPVRPPYMRCPTPYDLIAEGCYFLNLSDTTSSWLVASQKCSREHKGQLLRLESRREWDALKGLFIKVMQGDDDEACENLQGDKYLWTDGMSERGGDWVWAATGQKLTFFDWASGEPQSSTSPVSHLLLGCQHNFRWSTRQHDLEGNISRNYICETNPEILPAAFFKADPQANTYGEGKCGSLGGRCQDWRANTCDGGYLTDLCEGGPHRRCCKPCDADCQALATVWSRQSSHCDGECIEETNFCSTQLVPDLCEGNSQCCSTANFTFRAHRLQSHTKQITACQWSPANPYSLASASQDRTVTLWDLSNKPPTSSAILTHPAEIISLDWSPEGTSLATVLGTSNPSHIVWSSEGSELFSAHIKEGEISVKFSPRGTFFATGTSTGAVYIWKSSTGRLVKKMHTHSKKIQDLDWQSEDILASASDDSTVNIYNIHQGHIHTFHHKSRVLDIKWDPEGKWLASSSADKTIKIWSMEKESLTATLSGHTSWVTALEWSPRSHESSLLASASNDAKIYLWDVDRGKSKNILREHSNAISALSFTPDGRFLATGGRDGEVLIRNMNTEAVQERYKTQTGAKRSIQVGALSWNENADMLVICNGKNSRASSKPLLIVLDATPALNGSSDEVEALTEYAEALDGESEDTSSKVPCWLVFSEDCDY